MGTGDGGRGDGGRRRGDGGRAPQDPPPVKDRGMTPEARAARARLRAALDAATPLSAGCGCRRSGRRGRRLRSRRFQVGPGDPSRRCPTPRPPSGFSLSLSLALSFSLTFRSSLRGTSQTS